MKKIISGVLSVLMVVSCMAVPAFAAQLDTTAGQGVEFKAPAQHPENTMNPTMKVSPIGTKSFYKVNEDGKTVDFSDKDEVGYTAVPSAYIKNGQANDGTDYGMYVTKDGEVHFVALTECHNDGGDYTFYHGTKDSATVSTDVDTTTNEDETIGTQFYINIENGIEPPPETETVVPHQATGDPRVEYDITYATATTFNLKATVPMYVCMYGYRGTGNIVTPTKDAYQMKNYSTVTEGAKATITEIVKVTHLAQIIDNDHSNEELYSIAYDSMSGKYTYWYSDPSKAPDWHEPENYLVIADRHINASGENYVIFIDGKWEFKAAGVLVGDAYRQTVDAIDPAHPLTSDFIVGEWNFGKEFNVGDNKTAAGHDKTKGLAIKVTELEAKNATWKLAAADTAKLKQGELVMKIAPEKAQANKQAIDLFTCSKPLDITENGWFLDAPTQLVDGNVTVPTVLGLETSARMAGSNVNDAGCTPVVKVNYTVTPMFDMGNPQIDTAVVGG